MLGKPLQATVEVGDGFGHLIHLDHADRYRSVTGLKAYAKYFGLE